jgi:hypothetical protein
MGTALCRLSSQKSSMASGFSASSNQPTLNAASIWEVLIAQRKPFGQ